MVIDKPPTPWTEPPPGPPPITATPYPTAPPSGPPSGPPSTPDWRSLLENNPYYLAAKALSAQQLASLKARLGAGAARALVNLGDASLAGQVGGLNIPGGTGALVDQANQSGTSVLSQLLHAHALNTARVPAQLAGRGFYRSGQTGYALGEENRQYGQKGTQARQQTLDYLNQLYDNFVNQQFGIQQSDLNAYFQAYQQAMQNLGSYGGGAGTPTPTPAPTPVAGPTSYLDAGRRLFGSSTPFLGSGLASSGF